MARFWMIKKAQMGNVFIFSDTLVTSRWLWPSFQRFKIILPFSVCSSRCLFILFCLPLSHSVPTSLYLFSLTASLIVSIRWQLRAGRLRLAVIKELQKQRRASEPEQWRQRGGEQKRKCGQRCLRWLQGVLSGSALAYKLWFCNWGGNKLLSLSVTGMHL